MLSEVELLYLLLFVPAAAIGAMGFVIKIKFVPKFKVCHAVGNLTQ